MSRFSDEMRISLWLKSQGIAPATANAAAQKIAARLSRHQALAHDEARMVQMFLDRQGAQPAQDAPLRQSMARSAQSGHVPAHTPEWQIPRPGDPGNTAKPMPGRTGASTGAPLKVRSTDPAALRRLAQAIAGR